MSNTNNYIYVITPNPQYNSSGEFTGDSGVMKMSNFDLENIISKQLFPIEVVGGAQNYLKVKHLSEIKYVSDYVLTHLPRSNEHPVQISQIKDAIKMALIEGNIDINELRYFEEEEVREWKIAKANGELGPFGSIKR